MRCSPPSQPQRVDVFSFFGRSKRIEQKLDYIIKELLAVSTAEADLQAAVASLTTVATNAITLLNQLFATLQAGGTINPADIEAQVALINSQAAALGAAVTADTPAPAGGATASAAAKKS
jgi:hypothetical protein